MNTNKLNVIIYSEDTLQAYDASPINFEIKSEAPYIEFHTLGYSGMERCAGIPRHTLEMDVRELAKAELDPTTMRRIARYNLEKQNEVLTKEIDFKEAKLKHLTEQFERQEKRLADLQEVMKRFVKSDFDTVSEMFSGYEDEDCDDCED